MGLKYTTDWGDQFFPKVRLAREDEDGTSFTEAKRELLDELKEKAKHWRMIAGQVRKVRKEDIK